MIISNVIKFEISSAALWDVNDHTENRQTANRMVATSATSYSFSISVYFAALYYTRTLKDE
jgi:hypothetical protein